MDFRRSHDLANDTNVRYRRCKIGKVTTAWQASAPTAISKQVEREMATLRSAIENSTGMWRLPRPTPDPL